MFAWMSQPSALALPRIHVSTSPPSFHSPSPESLLAPPLLTEYPVIPCIRVAEGLGDLVLPHHFDLGVGEKPLLHCLSRSVSGTHGDQTEMCIRWGSKGKGEGIGAAWGSMGINAAWGTMQHGAVWGTMHPAARYHRQLGRGTTGSWGEAGRRLHSAYSLRPLLSLFFMSSGIRTWDPSGSHWPFLSLS